MLEIAMQADGEGVLQKDIAERQNISVKYLDHIIHALKVAGLVTNLKGKKSGYVLTRPAGEISMLDIHNAFEPGICVVECLSDNISCNREGHCSARGFWRDLNEKLIEYFSQTSLGDLVKEQFRLDDLTRE